MVERVENVITLRQEDIMQKKGLTTKQQAFVNELIDNPKQSATAAVRKTYNVTTDNSASQIATENLRKPQIIMALGKASELFESAIVGTVRDWGKSDNTRQREIALDAAKYGHDKVHGKAKQSVEIQSTTVSISIDLSGTDTPDIA